MHQLNKNITWATFLYPNSFRYHTLQIRNIRADRPVGGWLSSQWHPGLQRQYLDPPPCKNDVKVRIKVKCYSDRARNKYVSFGNKKSTFQSNRLTRGFFYSIHSNYKYVNLCKTIKFFSNWSIRLKNLKTLYMYHSVFYMGLAQLLTVLHNSSCILNSLSRLQFRNHNWGCINTAFHRWSFQ